MSQKYDRIMIAGATSLIAQETARQFALRHQSTFFLVGRNTEKLRSLAEDLRIRGAKQVYLQVADFCQLRNHAALMDDARSKLGEIDLVLVAWGDLGQEAEAQTNFEKAHAIIDANFLSVVALLTILTKFFERQKSGCIAVISSVAGDRGRRSNYIYGASKAGLSAFVQGMRSRLYMSGVRVLTVKPGPIQTPMTAHLKKGPLMATAESAGRGIYRAILGGSDIAYIPRYWWLIMNIIRHIPEFLFKRINI